MNNIRHSLFLLILSGILVISTVSTLSAQEKSNDKAQEYYSLGVKQLKSDKFEEGIKSFTECLQNSSIPEMSKMAHVYKGFCHRELRQFPQAMTEINAAIKIDPDDLASWFDRIHTRQEMGDYSGMIDDAKVILKRKPDAVQTGIAHYYMGVANFFRGDYKKSENEFSKALKTTPDDPEALIYRGTARMAQGDFDLAIADFDEVIRLAPDEPMAYEQRGRIKIQQLMVEYEGMVISTFAKSACADFRKARELGAEGMDELIELYCN